MCGLVGIAGDTLGNWKDIFAELLLFDVVRGPHSTGAGFVGRHNEKFEVIKRPGHPFNLFETIEYDHAMSATNSVKVIMGHNRFATIGDKTETNAHPFEFSNVIGMHNGTLDKWCLKELDPMFKYGTDSEAIFAGINESSVQKVIPELSGAWALVWFDKRDHTLNFLNNGRRPLHYCYSKDHCTLVWSSEVDLLRYTMNRRMKDVQKDDKDQEQYFSVTKDTLYSWGVPPGVNTKFSSPVQTELKGRVWKQPPAKTSFMHGGSHTQTKIGATSNISNDSIVPYSMRVKTHKFRQPYRDLYGKVVPKKEFFQMTSDGCAFCDENHQPWGQFIHIMGHFTGKNTPYMCEKCFNDGELYDYSQYAM